MRQKSTDFFVYQRFETIGIDFSGSYLSQPLEPPTCLDWRVRGMLLVESPHIVVERRFEGIGFNTGGPNTLQRLELASTDLRFILFNNII